MEALLKDISVIPGVLGSCVYDRCHGLLCKEQHPLLTEELTTTVGNHLIRLFQMARICSLDVQSMLVTFNRYVVLAMSLRKETVLFTVCSSHANCSLVSATARMLLDDMQQELQRQTSDVGKLEDDIEDLTTFDQLLQSEPAMDEDDLLLRPYLQQMEQALAAVIGPVASVVLEEYLARWRQSGPASHDRLLLLASMLRAEINDPVLEKEFMDTIANLL